jgi:hypothetical protein
MGAWSKYGTWSPKMTQAHRGKLPVVIPEGMTRLVVPIVVAKYTIECNIAVRNHIPMHKPWRVYKNQPALFDLFVARIHLSTFSSSKMHIFNQPYYSLTGNMFFHLNRLSLI